MLNIFSKAEQGNGASATPLFAGMKAPESTRGKTPFHKQLRWHIQQTEPHAAVMRITPEIATEMMRLNKSDTYQNRPQSEPTIAKYVRAMKAAWKLTGETIIVSKTGNLLNGQHRLEACIKSGCSFDTFVVFGIDDDAFSYMDLGKKRSTSDIFTVYGVPNASAMAAATMWLWKYENSGMIAPASWQYPTHDQLYDFFLSHPQFPLSHRAGHRFAEHRLAPASLMCALHYIAAGKNRALADAFFERLATGIGFKSSSEPEAKLRKRLINDKSTSSRLPDLFIGAFTVQAWNALRLKKPVGIFRWRGEQNPDQPFPPVL